MKSKADIIRQHLAGLRVLDIGGTGYQSDNAYEIELSQAWALCKKRTCIDYSPDADITIDLNALPLPPLEHEYDITTAFDVLEHLEHPADVLKWIPTEHLIVILPNAQSWIARRMEEQNKSKHLYSFTRYTASILLGEGGWEVKRIDYQFGKWSLLAKLLNLIGMILPSHVGTGIILYCERNRQVKNWKLR